MQFFFCLSKVCFMSISNLIMRLFTVYTITFASQHLRDLTEESCHWMAGHSGQYIDCLPDFYVKGACESGHNNDCKIDSLKGKDAFGLKCCPATKELDFRHSHNCQWLGGKTGEKEVLIFPKIFS